MTDTPAADLATRRSRLSPDQQAALHARLARDLGAPATSGIQRRSRPEEPAPATFAQRRLYFLSQLAPDSPFYTVSTAVPLAFALDADVLARAAAVVVERHEPLRTTFALRDGEPVQVVGAPGPVPVPVARAAGLPQARALAEAEARKPFDLERGPLLRLLAIRCAADRWVLTVTMHHIVCDGWSMGLFFRELTAAYGALSQGRAVDLPPLAAQYADWAVHERAALAGGRLDRSLAYWEAALGDAPALDLPTDRSRSAVAAFRGAHVDAELSPMLAGALRRVCTERGATLFMGLVATFAATLRRWSGQDDIVLGSPVAGRPEPELEAMIGFFVNSLVLRVDCSGDPDLGTLVERTRRTCLDAYAHQDVPFELLVDRLRVPRDASRNPVFQVTVQLADTPPGKGAPGPAALPVDRGAAIFDLAVHAWERPDGGLGIRCEHSTDLFDAATVERLLGHWHRLLDGALRDSGAPVGAVALLDADERAAALAAAAGPRRRWPQEEGLYERFAAQADARPAAVAVEAGEERTTFAALHEAAEALAGVLLDQGVRPGSLVGLALERSPAFVVALLAAWRAGAAYVPLDLALPDRRLELLLADAQPAVVVASPAAAGRAPLASRALVDPGDARTGATAAPDVPADPARVAYVLHTSGSTGAPKGVMVEHRSLLNHMHWMLEAFGLGPGDRILHKTPATFDASVWELVAPLVCGARMVLAPAGAERDPDALVRTLVSRRVTVAQFVPTHLALVAERPGLERAGALRHVFAGGEALPAAVARRVRTRLPKCAVHNLYGPTEATIDATWHTVGPDDTAGSVPIGRPVANVTAHVLDERLEPVPDGVPGELWLGGAAVARGYWRRPDLTAERFVADPFEPGGRLYRTGDVVRRRPDGVLEYRGRRDAQVKVRGHRIELAEVEAALAAVPDVAAAAAGVHDDPSGTQLVGYVVPRAGVTVRPGDLRAALAEHLPAWMVPARWAVLNELPRLPSGKVDRRRLPAAEPPSPAAGSRPPRSDAERVLAAIWAEVLGTRTVGVHDNFFELGGDSILTLRVVGRAAEHGLRLAPAQLFEHQTVADLARVARRVAATTADDGPVTGDAPLTPIQRWLLEQDRAEPHHYNQSVVVPWPRLADGVLEAAVAAVLERHDQLRARFARAPDGSWRQWIAPPGEPPPVRHGDAAAAARAQTELDLERGPLVQVVAMPEGRLAIVAHHLAVDAVSWRILLEDLADACRGEALRPRTTAFATWAKRLAAHAAELEPSELDAWLATRPPDDGAGAGPDASGPDELEGTARTVEVTMDEDQTAAVVTGLPAHHRSRPDEILLWALARAHAALGRPWLWLHVEGHGREDLFEDVDLSRTVGWFTTLHPVLLDLRAEPADPVAQLRVVKRRLRAVPARGIGYGLARHLHPDPAVREALAAVPEPRVAFNYLGRLGDGGDVPDVDLGPARGPSQRRAHALEVDAFVRAGRLCVHFRYSPGLEAAEDVDALATATVTAVDDLRSAGDDAAYAAVDFRRARVSDADLERLLRRFGPSEDRG